MFGSDSTAPYILEGYEDIWVETGSFVKNKLFTCGSLDGLYEKMDELHKQTLSKGNASVHVAAVPGDLAHPQTVQLMADLLHEMGGDVAVVSDGTFIGNVANITGVSGRLFAGDIYRENSYNINIPGTFNKHLLRLTLTGKELFALLEGGHSVTADGETAVFDYYWSGMDAKMEGGRIVSAVLSGGTPVEESGTYQVMIGTGDHDAAAYPTGEDLGILVSDAYLQVMEGKVLTAPGKLCR